MSEDASFDFICRFRLLTLSPRLELEVEVSPGVRASEEVVADGAGVVEDEDERVKGLNVDAANLRGLEASLLIWFPLLLDLGGCVAVAC